MIKRIEHGVWYKEDGAEVCILDTHRGRTEYRARTWAMAERQRGLCADCGKPMGDDVTFDHANGRGAGKRDDRIEVDGRWQNAALHLRCNSSRGSRRMPYVITQNS